MPARENTLSDLNLDCKITHPHVNTHERLRSSIKERAKLDKELEQLRAAVAAKERDSIRVELERGLRGAKEEIQKAGVKTRGLEREVEAPRAFLEGSRSLYPKEVAMDYGRIAGNEKGGTGSL